MYATQLSSSERQITPDVAHLKHPFVQRGLVDMRRVYSGRSILADNYLAIGHNGSSTTATPYEARFIIMSEDGCNSKVRGVVSANLAS